MPRRSRVPPHQACSGLPEFPQAERNFPQLAWRLELIHDCAIAI
jgi:hypothetical protein